MNVKPLGVVTMRDREGAAWTAAVLAVGALTLVLVLGAQDVGRQPILEEMHAERSALASDSVTIYLFSAQSDTVWQIYIPARGIPPLDTLGVQWWSNGFKYQRVWAGWNSFGGLTKVDTVGN